MVRDIIEEHGLPKKLKELDFYKRELAKPSLGYDYDVLSRAKTVRIEGNPPNFFGQSHTAIVNLLSADNNIVYRAFLKYAKSRPGVGDMKFQRENMKFWNRIGISVPVIFASGNDYILTSFLKGVTSTADLIALNKMRCNKRNKDYLGSINSNIHNIVMSCLGIINVFNVRGTYHYEDELDVERDEGKVGLRDVRKLRDHVSNIMFYNGREDDVDDARAKLPNELEMLLEFMNQNLVYGPGDMYFHHIMQQEKVEDRKFVSRYVMFDSCGTNFTSPEASKGILMSPLLDCTVEKREGKFLKSLDGLGEILDALGKSSGISKEEMIALRSRFCADDLDLAVEKFLRAGVYELIGRIGKRAQDMMEFGDDMGNLKDEELIYEHNPRLIRLNSSKNSEVEPVIPRKVKYSDFYKMTSIKRSQKLLLETLQRLKKRVIGDQSKLDKFGKMMKYLEEYGIIPE